VTGVFTVDPRAVNWKVWSATTKAARDNKVAICNILGYDKEWTIKKDENSNIYILFTHRAPLSMFMQGNQKLSD